MSKYEQVFFTGGKPVFWGAKNFNVSTKTLWSVLCGSYCDFNEYLPNHKYLINEQDGINELGGTFRLLHNKFQVGQGEKKPKTINQGCSVIK